MEKSNQNINQGFKGMNKDVPVDTNNQQTYTYMLNGNIESIDGNSVGIQNEQSNLLCTVFPEGYKVINYQLDITDDTVYYFLVNPDTNCSEIGKIRNIQNISNLSDTEILCGCGIKMVLAEGLETQEPTPICNYETVINDCDCNELEEGLRCLNFSINYPIDSEIKDEKCGKVLYFTDNYNERRRLEVDSLEQYYTKLEYCEEGDEDCNDCGTKEVQVCLNCTKMLVQAPFSIPCIDVKPIVNGGNLRHGLYVYYVAYSDKLGNELTRYMSVTGEVPVKDLNRNIYQQNELDAVTNLGIKLEVSNLDLNYKYFKIAVVEKTSVDGAVRYVTVGTYPIGENVVFHTANNLTTQATISLERLSLDFPQYKKSKYVQQIDNKLFFSDLEAQDEINLQPVVNLIGQFAKWRTVIAEEDIYKSSDLASKYRSNMRDEVIPYAIRFFTSDGYVTANFPLINRVAQDPNDLYFDNTHAADPQGTIETLLEEYKDSQIQPENTWEKDIVSTLVNGNSNCESLERIYKWQYYNTAIVEIDGFETVFSSEYPDCLTGETETLEDQDVTKYCISQYFTDQVGKIIISNFEEGEIFTTLEEYIEDHQNDPDPDANLDFADSGITTIKTSNYISKICCVCGEQDCDLACEDSSCIDCEVSEDCFVPCIDDVVEVNSCDLSTLFPEGICGEPCYDESKSKASFVKLHKCENEISIVKTYKDCNTYDRQDEPVNCYIYQQTTGGFTNLNVCCPNCSSAECTNADGDSCEETSPGANDGDPCCEWEYAQVMDTSGTGNCRSSMEVYDRVANAYGGKTCATASNVFLNQISALTAHLIPYYTNAGATDLVTSVVAGYSGNYGTLATIKSCNAGIGKSQPTGETAIFDTNIHKNALWFKVENIPTGVDKIVLTISDLTNTPSGTTGKDCLMYSSYHRFSLYTTCGTPLAGGLVEEPAELVNDVNNSIDQPKAGVLCIDTLSLRDDPDVPITTIYIAIDAPYWINSADTDYGYVVGTASCFSILAKSADIESVTVDLGTARLEYEKKCAYTAKCDLQIFKDVKCNPVPFSEGKFAYWESIEKYPDNSYLYNSTNLVINEDDIPLDIQTEFEDVFTSDTLENGDYELNLETTDFRCKPIRHFKFPDSCISPEHDGNLEFGLQPNFNKNKVFPIGLYLDNKIINAFLDVAAKPENALITPEFRDKIVGYEIFIGNMMLNRSIIGKGLLYDMYKYKEDNKDVLFSNFPFNTLGNNKLLYKDMSRAEFIDHPYNSTENDRFSFLSPDFSFDRPNLPFEMKIEHFKIGNSRGRFAQVEGHSKMVLLTKNAEIIAAVLAGLEEALLIVTKTLDSLVVAGTGTFGIGVSIAAISATLAAELVASFTYRGAQKTFQWLQIFDQNGIPNNFASYYASEGLYNGFSCSGTEGNLLRGLQGKQYIRNGRYLFNENFEETRINNFNRESSVYLNLGKDFKLEYPSQIKTYDDSRIDEAPSETEGEERKTSTEQIRNIASAYVSLKNYTPAQHGTINSISWISTSYCGDLTKENTCDTVFGGDTFIVRHTVKRKFPFFIAPMINGINSLPSLTPFSYSLQRNIGAPRYYVDYKTGQVPLLGLVSFPPIKSYYYLDNQETSFLYVKDTSKFYLYEYGIASFICETRINENFRYAENSRERDFWGNQNDYIAWTQEENVPIFEDNYYFYNNTYSADNYIYAWRALRADFDPVQSACQVNHWDRTIYSIEDNNEQDNIDNWRIFLPNNFKDFGNKYGTFYGVKPIESLKLVARFENGFAIYPSTATVQSSAGDVTLGTAGLFQVKPSDFVVSDLGYGGTQQSAWLSTEYGHFWVDAKRGRVHRLEVQAAGQEEISKNGMKNWFRENLPFNILKQFPNMSVEMLDNPYKGIGIVLGWDSRHERVFLTKKDVKLKQQYLNNVVIEGLDFYLVTIEDEEEVKTLIQPSDETYFTDTSWTLAYSPNLKTWISYYTFKPNYFVPFQHYFQTGINWGANTGLWSHLLTDNTSFQVFYGNLEPWKLEIPYKSDVYSKYGEDINYSLETLRYENENDFKHIVANFNHVVIYNNQESTGKLNLIRQIPNNARFICNYPKYNVYNSVDILATNEYQDWSFNYLFDNIKNNTNIPIWIHTPSADDKVLNQNAHDYRPTFKNLLRGKYFLARFTQETESRIKFIYKWSSLQNKLFD